MAALTLLAIVFGPILLAIESVSSYLFELVPTVVTWIFVKLWWLILLFIAVSWIWEKIQERRMDRKSTNGSDK